MNENELLHGPFKTDDFASYIYGQNDKIGGDNPVLEIRGWGYLTGLGHGALGLDHAAAVAEQKRFAQFVVDALNTFARTPTPVTEDVGDWVMVPRNLTAAMSLAGAESHDHWAGPDTLGARNAIRNVKQIWSALLSASPSPPKADGPGEVSVKTLEWQQNWPSDPLTGYAPVEPFNRYYLVDHDEPRFYAKSAVFGTDNHDKYVGNFGSFDEAKAACQSDYEARILSALVSPSTKREA